MRTPEGTLPDGNTRLYGVIGNPVSHSLSPTMHTAAFQSLSLNNVYLSFQFDSLDQALFKQAFNLIGICGFNITVPYKQEIIYFLDDISPQAKFLNSVNTVEIKDGRWIGHSTDGEGYIRSVEEFFPNLRDSSVQLLGAGGSAAAISYALLNAGVKKLMISNRTIGKAEKLVERLVQQFEPKRVEVGSYKKESYDLLVNTTSVGMDGESCPCSKELVEQAKIVSDIIYKPATTPLLKMAESMGKKIQNGLNMLIYQGAASFQIWTKQPAPVDVMKRVCKNQHYL